MGNLFATWLCSFSASDGCQAHQHKRRIWLQRISFNRMEQLANICLMMLTAYVADGILIL